MGVAKGDLGMLATEAMKQTRLLPNNPREVALRDAEELEEGLRQLGDARRTRCETTPERLPVLWV